VVAFGSRQTNKKINIIKTNDEDGSFRATSHLIDLGHRRIGLIQAPAGGIVNQNRTGGYIRALTGAGIGVRTDYTVPGGFSTLDGQRGAELLMSLSPAPTAIALRMTWLRSVPLPSSNAWANAFRVMYRLPDMTTSRSRSSLIRH